MALSLPGYFIKPMRGGTTSYTSMSLEEYGTRLDSHGWVGERFRGQWKKKFRDKRERDAGGQLEKFKMKEIREAFLLKKVPSALHLWPATRC